MKLKILVLADDWFDFNLSKTLNEHKDINFVLTLWDLTSFDLEDLKDSTIPTYWVYWNHCSRWYMELIWITNLHLNTIDYKGIKIWGFEGCIQYKPSWDFLYTHEESQELIKKLPYVDLLVLHSPPYWINNNSDDAHIWLVWIKDYVDNYSPKHLFHWHTYENDTFITKYKNTNIHYVYWEKIIEIEV